MRKFKTESKKLLDLMINSIYTNKEIFLRELISNASDAIDKLYFKSLTDTSIAIAKDDLAIRISYDKGSRIITISDNGIGMTKDELDRNLGIIAHSDSLDFKSENDAVQGGDVDIIGQFGVGFYSAFMVASHVSVVSRAYGSDEAWEWESDGVEGYTISESMRASHGTDVTLMLKKSTTDEDYDKYCDQWTLEELIKKYSNYVRYPIQMNMNRTRQKPIPEDAPDDFEPEYEEYKCLETINSMVPIWKRGKSDVSQEEYNEFYKSDFHDFIDPLRTMTIHAEGQMEYDALLFLPSHQAYDMYTSEFKKGLALYSSNVLIMEKCEELLPDYFNFVRGVVDSQDLTLNLSRETLQHNGQLHAIARRVEKKIKSELADMRDNAREEYEEFFKNFGRSLKYGVYADYGARKDVIADLLLFYSAKEQKMVTLDEYVDAMPEDQTNIFFAAGESLDVMAKLPIVSTVLARGYDVLLCNEEVDEFCLTMMHAYRECDLKNVSSGDLGLETQDEKDAAEAVAEENKDLLEAMKEALGEKVVDVKVSTKLTDAAACVTASGPVSLGMERVMAGSPGGEGVKSERVLELNPAHTVFEALKAAQKKGDTDKIALYSSILYDQALLVEGLSIEDPIAFAQAVAGLMK